MARSRREELRSKTYGLPLYCAAWTPLDLTSTSPKGITGTAEVAADKRDGVEKTLQTSGGDDAGNIVADSTPSSANGNQILLALGGGGGEGRSGVPNAVILTLFDLDSRSLSDHPVHRVGTGSEVPYRMAMHPGGDGFVCSFPNNCRWFEWDIPRSMEPGELAVKSPGSILQQLKNVGLQLALIFNSEGTALAAGSEDGHLRIFKWPSMDIFLNNTDAHSTIKHLDFSSDGKYLVSLGGSGPCRVWDLASSTALTTLQVEEGETFSFCRFSQNNEILYVTAMHGHVGKVISWRTSSWKRIGIKKIAHDPISAFSTSCDGKHLAIGTIEGDVAIINSSDLKVLLSVKKAHLGVVTALSFSADSRFLASSSIDSTATVTIIGDKKHKGSSLWLTAAVWVVVLAVLVYLIKGFLKIE